MPSRLSPLSPVYRALQRSTGLIVTAVVVAQTDMTRMVGGPLLVYALGGLAVAAVLGYELLYYRRFTYELTDDTLDIHSGVISRRDRELPYRRIQNVDISENTIQRLLGIAAVGLETAGGSSTEGSIRFVSANEARRLQREIQRRKRREQGEPDREPEPETELFALSPTELGLIGVLSFDLRVLGVLSLVGPGSIPFLSDTLEAPMALVGVLGGVLVLALLGSAWLLGIVVAVVNYYGFRLTRAEDELRYERGLFRRYTGSIPDEKVQALTIEDNPLKRYFGYATLKVETAGYSPGRGESRSSLVAIPIAKRARVEAVADRIEPLEPIEFDRPPTRVRRRYAARYLIALGVLLGAAYGVVTYLGLTAPWYALAGLAVGIPPAVHLKWRHRGVSVGDAHVVTRNGVWLRTTKIVPYYRIQSVIDTRTIFQRRWDLATVSIDTAGTLSIVGQGAAAVDIDVETADTLRGLLTDRLQAAILGRRQAAADRPSRWDPPSPETFEW